MTQATSVISYLDNWHQQEIHRGHTPGLAGAECVAIGLGQPRMMMPCSRLEPPVHIERSRLGPLEA